MLLNYNEPEDLSVRTGHGDDNGAYTMLVLTTITPIDTGSGYGGSPIQDTGGGTTLGNGHGEGVCG